jgi:hypothetical protein
LKNRFNGFYYESAKTVETVTWSDGRVHTGLKPGVNESTFEAKLQRNNIFQPVGVFAPVCRVLSERRNNRAE